MTKINQHSKLTEKCYKCLDKYLLIMVSKLISYMSLI